VTKIDHYGTACPLLPGHLGECPVHVGNNENPARNFWDRSVAAGGGECEILRLACVRGRNRWFPDGMKAAMRQGYVENDISRKMKWFKGVEQHDAGLGTGR
jgi:hypothetical protein